MRLLRMVIVPLVLASIVSGVASISGGRAIGRLFGKTLGYYLLTSFLAAATGLVGVNLFRPGVGAALGNAAAGAQMPELDTPTSGVELLLGIVPTNVLSSAAAGDMLPIIFFSIVLGTAIANLKADDARGTLIGFFNAFFQAMVALTSGIVRLLPIGVFALITRMVGTTGFESFGPLIWYFLTVATGLTVHLFVTLPLALVVLARISPAIHFKNLRNPLLIAFSTSSAAATLPVTMRTAEERVGVSNQDLVVRPPDGGDRQHGRHRDLRVCGSTVHRPGHRVRPVARRADGGGDDGAARLDRGGVGAVGRARGDLHRAGRHRARRPPRGRGHRPSPCWPSTDRWTCTGPR